MIEEIGMKQKKKVDAIFVALIRTVSWVVFLLSFFSKSECSADGLSAFFFYIDCWERPFDDNSAVV